MDLSYNPLKILAALQSNVPRQYHSSNNTLDLIINFAVVYIEKHLLGIDKQREVKEFYYESPIKTKHPNNNVGHLQYFKGYENAAVIVVPQRGSGYNVGQLVAEYFSSRGISTYLMEIPHQRNRLPMVYTA